MQKSILRVSLGMLVCAAGAACASAQVDRVGWNRHVDPFRIAGNIYYVGAEGVSSFLITDADGLIVLDGGFEETAPEIEKNIRKLGFNISDVKYVLASHAHYDHCGGLARLKKDSGGRLAASEPERPTLESGMQRSLGKGQGTTSFPAVKVDRVMHDGDRIELGKIKMTAHLTAGHTRGCTSWTMPVEDAERSYNVVFHCSSSVAGNSLVQNPKYPNIVADYRKTFAYFAQLPCDIFLGPHPFFFDMEAKRRQQLISGNPNPFVRPGELQEFNRASEADFNQELRKQQREAGTQ